MNSIANLGTGLVTFDNDGNIVALPYDNDPTKVLYSNGTWGTINFSNSGWTNGYDIVYNGTGNVGIGTFTPQYKLDVWGNMRVTGTVFASGVVISDEVNADTGRIPVIVGNTSLTGDVGIGGGVLPNIKLNVVGDVRTSGKIQVSRIIPLPGDSLIRFGDSTFVIHPTLGQIYNDNSIGVKGVTIGRGNTLATGANSCAIGFRIRVGGTNGVYIGSGTPTGLTFFNFSNSFGVGFNSDIPTFFVGTSNGLNTTGNVGIATTNPTEKLQVNSGNILIKGTNNFTNAGDASFLYLGDNSNYIKSTFSGDISIGIFGAGDVIKVQQNGNVGIGTLNPVNGFKLAVNGKIRAKEIIVETSWSDFVFYPGYFLMPLDSVQKFIDVNGHLPNVPPAKQVEENGLSLGESNAILLMKIEELTLYLLQQQKEINLLKQQVQNK